MLLSNVKTDKDWEKYLFEKEMGTWADLQNEMFVGEIEDENGFLIHPLQWYWRGCSPEMNYNAKQP